MKNKDDDEEIKKTILKNEKILKKIESQLDKIDKMRKKIGLDKGASGALVEKVPQTEDLYKESMEKLLEISGELKQDKGTGAKKENKKDKRLGRLARAMKKNLKI